MPQSLASVVVHATFSTLNRTPWISDAPSLHAYIGSISKQLGCQPIIVGGVADHVHILAVMSRTETISNWIKEIKRVSSVHMKPFEPRFTWQSGYAVFSVGKEQIDTVRAYITNQEEHHRNVNYQEEYRQILTEHGIEWDERYVWE